MKKMISKIKESEIEKLDENYLISDIEVNEDTVRFYIDNKRYSLENKSFIDLMGNVTEVLRRENKKRGN
ncbi:MAG: hypothetical protein QM490_01945 [Candidatus Gracilibacteria bacterium]